MALDKGDPFPQLPRRSLFAGADVTKPVTKPSPRVTKPPPEVAAVTRSASTLAEKPLGGRPPAGDRAMTGAERVRKLREAKKGK
jgi:hypothetical protein